jgi:hypothetical protein
MEKTKEVESKQAIIEKLQKQAITNKQLDIVEEVLCYNCKNSLEDSQLFSARLSVHHGHQASTSSAD